MNTEWTAKRLSERPEGTVFEVSDQYHTRRWLVRGDDYDGQLMAFDGTDVSVEEIDFGTASIRVVAVPPSALLSDETAAAAAVSSGAAPWAMPVARKIAQASIRAAIAHVTGKAL